MILKRPKFSWIVLVWIYRRLLLIAVWLNTSFRLWRTMKLRLLLVFMARLTWLMMKLSTVRVLKRPFLNVRNSWNIWLVSLLFWLKQSLFCLKNSAKMGNQSFFMIWSNLWLLSLLRWKLLGLRLKKRPCLRCRLKMSLLLKNWLRRFTNWLVRSLISTRLSNWVYFSLKNWDFL